VAAENVGAKACMTAYARLDQAFLASLFAITFPPEMKADVDALITAGDKLVTVESVLASLQQPLFDTQDFTRFEQDDTDYGAAANVVRHDLGLPPRPTAT
jgi:hypothetical protein